MAIEMKKIKLKMNNSIYLDMSRLDISKTHIYEFWYDYIKPKCQEKAKLCCMDTDSFIIYVKTKYFYENIANDIEKQFDTSNYDENDKRPLPIGTNKKQIGLFKDELGGKIQKEFAGPRAKTYVYLMDDNTEHKKAKGTKKCVKKEDLCLKAIQIACLMIKSY